ncbi:MAG: DUF6632 domain-containing protein [Candidatus Curtissbacteria bacterium]
MRDKEKILRQFLYWFGLGNIFVHPILPWFFHQQFFWTPRNIPYEFMIGGMYIAWGIVMVAASKEPLKHKLFIDFTILGNLFHTAVMIFFGIVEQPMHLYGDVLWISALWIIPLLYYPWGIKNFLRSNN